VFVAKFEVPDDERGRRQQTNAQIAIAQGTVSPAPNSSSTSTDLFEELQVEVEVKVDRKWK
jgi:hypothetical protein